MPMGWGGVWNRWTEFNETWQEARSQRPLPSLCFSGRSEKTRWPPWPLIGWDIFDFSSETAEWNSTKLDRKQDLNVLYQVCVFRADRKNKIAALASDWLRLFRLLLWNRWTEFNESWQEARFQRPLPSLCFSGRSEKQDGRPGLWLAETFSTSPLKPLDGIQRNLTGSKISMSSTRFVFFRADRKKHDGRPGLWLAETFSTSSLKPLNGIQRNLTGSKISTSSTKFVFFRPMSKQKLPLWLIWKVAHGTQVHNMGPFGPLVCVKVYCSFKHILGVRILRPTFIWHVSKCCILYIFTFDNRSFHMWPFRLSAFSIFLQFCTLLMRQIWDRCLSNSLWWTLELGLYFLWSRDERS